MKIIKKKIQARTIISYQCEICGKKYRTPKKAKECEERKTEEKLFTLGDSVKITGLKFECNINKTNFWAKGEVGEIRGPEIADYDYECRWLEGKKANWHVYWYLIMFQCSCGKKRGYWARTTELKTSK